MATMPPPSGRYIAASHTAAAPVAPTAAAARWQWDERGGGGCAVRAEEGAEGGAEGRVPLADLPVGRGRHQPPARGIEVRVHHRRRVAHQRRPGPAHPVKNGSW